MDDEAVEGEVDKMLSILDFVVLLAGDGEPGDKEQYILFSFEVRFFVVGFLLLVVGA
jgi:hypothetical protein